MTIGNSNSLTDYLTHHDEITAIVSIGYDIFFSVKHDFKKNEKIVFNS